MGNGQNAFVLQTGLIYQRMGRGLPYQESICCASCNCKDCKDIGEDPKLAELTVRPTWDTMHGGQLGQLATLQQFGPSWMNIESILNIVLIVGCRWWWCCVVIDRPGGGRGSWWAPKWAPGSSNGQGLPPMEILCFFSVTLLEAFARTGYTYQQRTFYCHQWKSSVSFQSHLLSLQILTPQLQQEEIFWKLSPGLDIQY